MFRIGDFAKMARISVKTLHHYDEIGLFKPELVHPSTGYRSYHIEQLSRLNHILVLKDLGFTLIQIRAMLNEGLSHSELRSMLHLKETELTNHILEEQEHLKRVKIRLRQIECEGTHNTYDILVKPVEPQAIASARGLIPLTDDTFQQCADLATAIYQWLHQTGSRFSDRWYSLYHETTSESRHERIDIEMAVEVETSLLMKAAHFPSDQVKVWELPGTPAMAYLLLSGSYDRLWDAHISLMTWIEDHGYCSTGSTRCIYLRRPSPHEEPLTELQIPIEPGH